MTGQVFFDGKTPQQIEVHEAKSKKKGGKVRKKKNLKKKIVDPLVTSHIIKKTRTNPNANITLSGKKRRLLLKQLKREEQEKKQMEVEVVKQLKIKKAKNVKDKNNIERMDLS